MTALVLLAAVLLGLPVPVGLGQEVVGEIRFEGSSRIREERLRTALRTREGQPFSERALDADLKTLYRDFKVYARLKERSRLADGRLLLVLELVDTLTVRKVEFNGNKKLSDDELQEELGLSASGYVSRGLWGGQFRPLVNKLENLYDDEGYLYREIYSPTLEKRGDEFVLVFQVLEGPKVEVDDIVFEGLKAFKARHLRSLMQTSESFWFFSQTFKRGELERDITILEQFYRDEGYLDAQVSLEAVVPNQDYDEVDVILRVEEGERYTVGDVRVDGNEHFAEEELLPLLKMKRGAYYRRNQFNLDTRSLLRYYGDRGYIRCSIGDPVESYELDRPVVHVTYRIFEGGPKRIRDVRVVGNINTEDEVVRRELNFYPGQIINKSAVDRAEDRLKASGFFVDRQGRPLVRVRYEPTDDPRYEDVVVEVEDGPSGFINFIAGIGSGAGFFFGIDITKENFDITDLPSGPLAFFSEFFDQRAFHGGGQRFRLRANPGSQRADYTVSFTEPFLTGPIERPIFLETEVHYRELYLRLYDEERVGGTVQIGKRLDLDTRVSFGFRIERIDIDDIDITIPDLRDVVGTNNVRSVLGRFSWRDLNSLRNPTKGRTLDLFGELEGGPLGADVDVYKVTARSEWLVPVYENEDEQVHVLAFKGAVVYANEYGDSDDVPLFERYFAGGAGTFLQMRGFDYRGMGPHQNGEAVGGSGGFVVNTEYIFPLYEYYEPLTRENVPFLRGLAFTDIGMLESDWEDIPDGRLRASVGVGVRLKIPIQILSAPLELYYGIPVSKANDDERQAFTINFSTRF